MRSSHAAFAARAEFISPRSGLVQQDAAATTPGHRLAWIYASGPARLRFALAKNMARWTYVFNEVSAGYYIAEAIRETNQSIERRGFREVIPAILRESFRMEISMGTSPEDAALDITKGFTKFWFPPGQDTSKGSWLIHDSRTGSQIEYSKNNGIISMVRNTAHGSEIFWRGHVSELSKDESNYYERLAKFH